MTRDFPKRGSFLVGLSPNQLLGSTEDPPQNDGEIVNHLFFAHSYSEEEAKLFAIQGYTTFIVELGLRLQMVDFFPEIAKHKPFVIPIQTETNILTKPKVKFARVKSIFGCKHCTVRYLEVGINATVCDVCQKHLKCNSCGHCICES